MPVLEYLIVFLKGEDGIRDGTVTGVQTCALPICVMKDWAALAKFCKEKGVEFEGLCAYGETGEEILRYAQKNGIEYALLMDDEAKAAKILGASVVTESYLVGKDGKLAYKGAFKPGGGEPIKDALEELLAGKAVSKRETPAGG